MAGIFIKYFVFSFKCQLFAAAFYRKFLLVFFTNFLIMAIFLICPFVVVVVFGLQLQLLILLLLLQLLFIDSLCQCLLVGFLVRYFVNLEFDKQQKCLL